MDDAQAQKTITVDLPNQVVISQCGQFKFEIDAFLKHCLINGLDDIGLTLQKEAAIIAFEDLRSERYPWLDGPQYSRSVAEVRVSTARSAGFYTRTAKGFLAGLPATEDLPPRPPAGRVCLSGAGGSVERVARAAVELEAEGAARVVNVATDLLENPKGGPGVPSLRILIEAVRKAPAPPQAAPRSSTP